MKRIHLIRGIYAIVDDSDHESLKRIYLGSYRTARVAARAYDNAALKYHGEFALTNKMLGLL